MLHLHYESWFLIWSPWIWYPFLHHHESCILFAFPRHQKRLPVSNVGFFSSKSLAPSLGQKESHPSRAFSMIPKTNLRVLWWSAVGFGLFLLYDHMVELLKSAFLWVDDGSRQAFFVVVWMFHDTFFLYFEIEAVGHQVLKLAWRKETDGVVGCSSQLLFPSSWIKAGLWAGSCVCWICHVSRSWMIFPVTKKLLHLTSSFKFTTRFCLGNLVLCTSGDF